MDVTITLKDAGLIIMGVGLIILIGYSIAFMKNLVQSVKHTNKILEDTRIITKIAAGRAKDVDQAVSDIAFSVGSVSDMLKGNQNIISALTSVINAIVSLRNIINKGGK